MFHSPIQATALALSGLFFIAGCGPVGPVRYELAGRISFQGKPVPAGTIIFEPDYSKGNDGPQGLAVITNGTYNTARGGKGTVGGPHMVTVLGCDGVNVSETSPQGKLLFDPYITSIEIPKQTAKHDIEVPAKGASR
jgi:hypothetical protein